MDISEWRERARRFIEESEAVLGPREPWYYALKLSEESGEAVKAYNRFSGLSRKSGTLEELLGELGDTVFMAFILAEKIGAGARFGDAIDSGYANVMSRGFKEDTNAEYNRKV